MRRAALALVALIAAGPALAQQKMGWYSIETDQGGALIYGVPDTEEAAIFFVCARGADSVTAQSVIGSKDLEAGAEATLDLVSGKVKKSLAGKVVASETVERLDVEAPLKLADMRALLKGKGPLTVTVKGATQKVALAGVAAALASFEGYCKQPKS